MKLKPRFWICIYLFQMSLLLNFISCKVYNKREREDFDFEIVNLKVLYHHPPPPPPVVCSTDRSKAVVPVLVLLLVGLWFILRGDLLYVFPCVILFLCFSVLLVLRLPRLGKRELILVLFVRLFGLCLFRFVGFLFLLGSGKGCGLWLWHSLDFSLSFLHTTPVVFVPCVEILERLPVHAFNGVIISSARVCTLQSPFVFLFLMILIYTSSKVRYLPLFVSRL